MEAAEDKAAQESSRGSFDRGIARLREMRTKKPRQVRVCVRTCMLGCPWPSCLFIPTFLTSPEGISHRVHVSVSVRSSLLPLQPLDYSLAARGHRGSHGGPPQEAGRSTRRCFPHLGGVSCAQPTRGAAMGPYRERLGVRGRVARAARRHCLKLLRTPAGQNFNFNFNFNFQISNFQILGRNHQKKNLAPPD